MHPANTYIGQKQRRAARARVVAVINQINWEDEEADADADFDRLARQIKDHGSLPAHNRTRTERVSESGRSDFSTILTPEENRVLAEAETKRKKIVRQNRAETLRLAELEAVRVALYTKLENEWSVIEAGIIEVRAEVENRVLAEFAALDLKLENEWQKIEAEIVLVRSEVESRVLPELKAKRLAERRENEAKLAAKIAADAAKDEADAKFYREERINISRFRRFVILYHANADLEAYRHYNGAMACVVTRVVKDEFTFHEPEAVYKIRFGDGVFGFAFASELTPINQYEIIASPWPRVIRPSGPGSFF